MSKVFPSCPRCRGPVPFSKSLVGRGTPFSCRRCGADLVVPKAGSLLAIGIFGLLAVAGKFLLEMPNGGWVVVAIIAAGMVLEYLLLTVEPANTGSG